LLSYWSFTAERIEQQGIFGIQIWFKWGIRILQIVDSKFAFERDSLATKCLITYDINT